MTKRLTKLLVIGVGSIGERHVRCFLKTGRVEVSICESNPQLCRQVADRYRIAEHFTDVDHALAKPLDAALIATPAHLHIGMAQKVIDRRLHVLIEKPLAVSLDGVESLVQSIQGSNRVAAIAYVLRSHPSLAAMRDAIQSKQYGTPVQVYVTAGQHFPTYRPAYATTYFRARATGGGAVQDAMTHLVNAAEWLVGPVSHVAADASHQLLPDVEVEDVVHFLARHGTVLGSYSLNQFQAPNEVTITVVCEQATFRYEGHNHRWRMLRGPDGTWIDQPATCLERDTLFYNQATAFLDAVEGTADPLCSLPEGLQSLRVNLALLKSIESRSWQSVDAS